MLSKKELKWKIKWELIASAIVLLCMSVGIYSNRLYEARLLQESKIQSLKLELAVLHQIIDNQQNLLTIKPTEVIKEVVVVREVVKEVSVEKIVYQQISVKDWQSIDEFRAKLPQYEYFSGGCLSIAEMLQQSLMKQGYPVSIALEYNGYYYATCVRSRDYYGIDTGHAGLLVGIKSSWYFYEPESKTMTKLF